MIKIADKDEKAFINAIAYIYYKALMNEDTDTDTMKGYLRGLEDILGTPVTDQIAKQGIRLMIRDSKNYGLSDEDLFQIFMESPAFKATFKNDLHDFLKEDNNA